MALQRRAKDVVDLQKTRQEAMTNFNRWELLLLLITYIYSMDA